MHIDKALKLKVGDPVTFPADRGSPAGTGKVEHVGEIVNTNLNGVKYVWVNVRHSTASAVWPSNRLS